MGRSSSRVTRGAPPAPAAREAPGLPAMVGLCLAVVAASALPTAGRSQPTSEPALPSVELPPEIQRVLTDYERAWRARDAEALAALFTPDGFVLAPGRPPVRGREAIEDHYGGRGGPLSLRALAYAVEGTVGWIIGGYAPDPGLPDGGKFTLTLRRGPDGRWRIVSDMDNRNR